MNSLFYYINILLPTHKCVTLPKLGAFILNEKERELHLDDNIVPNKYAVSFNSELQHDDGVISSYIQSAKGISYDSANKELLTAIKELKKQLLHQESVDFGVLGKFYLSQGQVLFAPNKDYSCPSHYGLSPVALDTVHNIKNTSERINRNAATRKKLMIASVSAAAALLLLFPSNTITDTTTKRGEQQAGYFKSFIETKKTVLEEVEKQPIIQDLNIPDATMPISLNNSTAETEKTVVEKKKSGRTYYIIVGGANSKNTATKIIEQFEVDGLNNLQIVESADRYRIYASSYDDKQEAEKAVIQFRQDNPKYETAWLYSQRN